MQKNMLCILCAKCLFNIVKAFSSIIYRDLRTDKPETVDLIVSNKKSDQIWRAFVTLSFVSILELIGASWCLHQLKIEGAHPLSSSSVFILFDKGIYFR